jgi:hypothetical protein
MTTAISADSVSQQLPQQKLDVLLAFHRVCWEEMTWRRNAGYRTVILGLGYCAAVVLTLAFNHATALPLRICLAAVMTLATLFGAGYLMSNYRKYMGAMGRMVLIELHLGAYDPEFLGPLGALMPAERRLRPTIPLQNDPVCLWSIIAFAIGGLLTAAAALLL